MLRSRLHDTLDSPLPLVGIEATVGSGKRTLLDDWCSAPNALERRVLVDAEALIADVPHLLRLVWFALNRHHQLNLVDLPTDPKLVVETAIQQLLAVPHPLAISVVGADRLSAPLVDCLLDLIPAGVRLVLAGFDITHVVERARSRGISLAMLDEQHLYFTLDETRTLMAEAGHHLSSKSLHALHHATKGHPGLILTALDQQPDECQAGTLTPDRALSLFLSQLAPRHGESPFGRFMATMSQLPRFCDCAAETISMSATPTASLNHRLQRQGYGQMRWHTGIRQRVFQWHEPIRMVLGQYLYRLVAEDTDLPDRIIEAAETCSDHSLLIATLVSQGKLAEAESRLHHWLWDVIPNGDAPLWQALNALAPSELHDFPSLLCIRMRMVPPLLRSQHSQLSLVVGRLTERATTDPWQRLANFARALELSSDQRGSGAWINLTLRTRGLLDDLAAGDVIDSLSAAGISDILLVADVMMRTGNTATAAHFAEHALRFIDAAPQQFDPAGERAAFAGRVVLQSYRYRGLEDPLDPTPLLGALQFVWRDSDLVAARIAMMWEALDGDDLDAADAHLRMAADRVSGSTPWPALTYLQAWLAVLRQDHQSLQALLDGYATPVASTDTEARLGEPSVEAPDTVVSPIAGRPVHHPEWVPLPEEDPNRPHSARIMHNLALQQALKALRAGHPDAARVSLERAIHLLPRRTLAPVLLAHASSTEVDQLSALISDHPQAPLLNLPMAMRWADVARQDREEFSERELQVLGHLRAGATNSQMAERMFISVNTVKFHRSNLMRKLGARSRDEALAAALSLSL